MSIQVGIIGTGLIGEAHGRKLASVIGGASVGGVTDVRHERAEEVAAALGGPRVFDTGHELIASDEIDAVLVTSIGETHAEYVLACIAAGKPVMCEKPLAPTVSECQRIIEAEVAYGKHLVIVGFMRRYDAGYREVKATLDSGTIGEALILHNVHRNPTVPESYTSFMTMTDSMIHEVDVSRWLLGEEITAVQVIPPKRTPKAFPHLQDPQFAVFTTESGVLSTVEFFANAQYGYDVRCELVGSLGTASLTNPSLTDVATAGQLSEAVAPDWRVRFGTAYTSEVQAWISGLARGECIGPSAWEGYAATKVVEVGVDAVKTGERHSVDYIEKPAMYR
jgi:myo-inositol 2-dehydrogenase/D-chiro-inositol 1-dehydrogenase